MAAIIITGRANGHGLYTSLTHFEGQYFLHSEIILCALFSDALLSFHAHFLLFCKYQYLLSVFLTSLNKEMYVDCSHVGLL